MRVRAIPVPLLVLTITACPAEPPVDGETGELSTSNAEGSTAMAPPTTSSASASTSTSTTDNPSSGSSSSSTGALTADTDSDGDESSGDSGEPYDTYDTGEPDDDPPLFPGDPVICSETVWFTFTGALELRHSATRVLALDEEDNLGVWRAQNKGLVRAEEGVSRAELAGDTVVFERAGQLEVVNAVDGATLGTCAAQPQWGLARDGSYLWTAGDAALRVHELDGTLRWSVAGAFAGATALATGEAVHVFAAGVAPQAVQRLAAMDGSATSHAFSGEFGGWFADLPRWWTVARDTHRVFDLDGAPLGEQSGVPAYGWGTRVVVGTEVRDIFAPGVLAEVPLNHRRFSGPAIFIYRHADEAWHSEVLNLDTDPVSSKAAAPERCPAPSPGWDFAYSGGEWVVSCRPGVTEDRLHKFYTHGFPTQLAGSAAGRVAFTTAPEEIRVFDVVGDCAVTPRSTLKIDTSGLDMANDGSRLMTGESWEAMPGYVKPGNRFYALPGGEEVGSSPLYVTFPKLEDYEISDDGGWYARLGAGQDFFNLVRAVPSGEEVPDDAPGNRWMPRISPDAQRSAFTAWTGPDQANIVIRDQAGEPVATFPGYAVGFVDDEHILVQRRDGGSYDHSEVVDLAGVVVASPDLPDLARLYRLGTGEFLAPRKISVDAAIHDPTTGAALWQAPSDTLVALAGDDHLLLAGQGRVWIARWR